MMTDAWHEYMYICVIIMSWMCQKAILMTVISNQFPYDMMTDQFYCIVQDCMYIIVKFLDTLRLLYLNFHGF